VNASSPLAWQRCWIETAVEGERYSDMISWRVHDTEPPDIQRTRDIVWVPHTRGRRMRRDHHRDEPDAYKESRTPQHMRLLSAGSRLCSSANADVQADPVGCVCKCLQRGEFVSARVGTQGVLPAVMRVDPRGFEPRTSWLPAITG
jgi:hypothetical protein